MSRASLNRLWAKLTLEVLVRQGVSDICIAPGSRSTPLTLEAQQQQKLTIHTHFDERGLGFFALGLAKRTQRPVAIVVTSGTAVANLLPAIVESGLTREKLIALTADRPVELVGCGANQAIQQQGIFSSHVTSDIYLPTPSLDISPRWLLTTLEQALSEQQQQGGSIHINCAFPEPLYGEEDAFTDYLKPIQHWLKGNASYCHKVKHAVCDAQPESNFWHKRGVIIVGQIDAEDQQPIMTLAKQLGWPLLVDPQSGISSLWHYSDLWLQNNEAYEQLNKAEVVLQLGCRLVSKRALQFIEHRQAEIDSSADNQHQNYWLISTQSGRLDPHHLALTQVESSPITWIEQLDFQQSALKMKNSGWADTLLPFIEQVEQINQQQLLSFDKLTELVVAKVTPKLLGENCTLFIGNSLIVRLLDMVASIDLPKVYSNRGASGIDGLIATSAGVSAGDDDPICIMIGDTSLLYDLNSLALLRQQHKPIVVIVTNNDGGAIFDLLPVPHEQKQSLYQMPHGLQFKDAASMFGLDYLQPQNSSQYQSMLQSSLLENKTTLIEVVTPAGEANQELAKLVTEIKLLPIS
ncbi:2-succinyl-5-enolpyruvyl-6-hydroxy-3-cyclohexene-1-carboxylic-acid synthase [Vibrio sp. SS-MA-C1-2]|uniref:2-succinyl-5-enolpyruvyl-6-hydroxy-3- cyclohexene-1-carboxylic-acid synthase n=1 Tax=Vibrio sp. SS-MA-C1-2 TaxID=2908646 RepID=UPI001F3B880F|nr:2-succinyl-5-enolpyruvyl-6-hydroxy-3-cyclohexene-1-carboxylic-acid synthase [Vibrio sp. SS-MA-C1-2]UJF19949.1 2-succinyl-5-enolpyruvyl-6-hydroxy-3-cyclohexene-1-carboxylic-acid synthase [Vibrio sp. SS-MA-C1-2]